MATTCAQSAPDVLRYERAAYQNGFVCVAGVDEAGRGPLAGPVVAAAVVLPRRFINPGIRDSKKLTPKRRAHIYDAIQDIAVAMGVGRVDPEEIDRINILQASLLAMSLAVSKIAPLPDFLLIDGQFPIPLDLPQETIIKGDVLSVSISAASIVAKVTRDRLMEEYSNIYPQYGFERHKGYGTRFHQEAIKQHGCCPIHRRTFRGVREFI